MLRISWVLATNLFLLSLSFVWMNEVMTDWWNALSESWTEFNVCKRSFPKVVFFIKKNPVQGKKILRELLKRCIDSLHEFCPLTQIGAFFPLPSIKSSFDYFVHVGFKLSVSKNALIFLLTGPLGLLSANFWLVFGNLFHCRHEILDVLEKIVPGLELKNFWKLSAF